LFFSDDELLLKQAKSLEPEQSDTESEAEDVEMEEINVKQVCLGAPHPDTQAIFTSVASFNALTKSDTIPRVSRPFPSHNCHRAVLLSV
jgi:hypothetical protein